MLLKLLKIYKIKVTSISIPFVNLKESLLFLLTLSVFIRVLIIVTPSILFVEVSLYHVLPYKSVATLS